MINEIEQIIDGTITGITTSENANGVIVTVQYTHDGSSFSVTTSEQPTATEAEAEAVTLVSEAVAP